MRPLFHAFHVFLPPDDRIFLLTGLVGTTPLLKIQPGSTPPEEVRGVSENAAPTRRR